MIYIKSMIHINLTRKDNLKDYIILHCNNDRYNHKCDIIKKWHKENPLFEIDIIDSILNSISIYLKDVNDSLSLEEEEHFSNINKKIIDDIIEKYDIFDNSHCSCELYNRFFGGY